MPTTMIPIPAGALFTITTGDYSDYSIHGVFRALREINADALQETWLTNHPEQRVHYNFREDEFLAWIAREGYMEAVNCFEWHLCDYSSVGEMTVRKIEESTP
jgi:hypothetical protein